MAIVSDTGTPKRTPKHRRRGHGEGSITERSDGRWQATVNAGYVDGKRKRLYAYAETQREAIAALDGLKRRAKTYQQQTAEVKTVAQFLDHWLTSTVVKTRAPKTVESYRGAIRLHIVPAIGKKRLATLNRVDVQRMLDAVAKKPKPRARAGEDGVVPTVGPRTVENVRSVLRAALSDAVKWKMIESNPVEHTVIEPVRPSDRQALTVDQARALFDEVREDRFEAVYILAAVYGLRRGECLGLRWSDVDEDAGEIRVRQQVIVVNNAVTTAPLKTRASNRTLPLLGIVREALARRRDHQAEEQLLAGLAWRDTGLVFTSTVGTPYQPANLHKRWRTHLEGAGLPIVPFHSLRHTAASFLVALGVHPRVAMEILGHTSIKTTMEVYSHAQQAGMRDALESVEHVLRRAENGRS